VSGEAVGVLDVLGYVGGRKLTDHARVGLDHQVVGVGGADAAAPAVSTSISRSLRRQITRSPAARAKSRSVRLLPRLAADLGQWRMASSRPPDRALVFGRDGGVRGRRRTGATGAGARGEPGAAAPACRRRRARMTCATPSPRCCSPRAARSTTSPPSSGTLRRSRSARTAMSWPSSPTLSASMPRPKSPARGGKCSLRVPSATKPERRAPSG
jgi:hypothetical protein